MKYLTLSTYLIYRSLLPFLPETHPFKMSQFELGYAFSLQDWYDGSTDLNVMFSGLLWGSFITLVYLGILYVY